MRVFGKINIIGLDNGYGNIKTANGIVKKIRKLL